MYGYLFKRYVVGDRIEKFEDLLIFRNNKNRTLIFYELDLILTIL